MRIAYIAPYQGPTLGQKRPIGSNLSFGARAKIELIAELLQKNSHTVEILSSGDVVEQHLKHYPGFREPDAFNSQIPVYYSSVLPVRYMNAIWSSASTLRLFRARHATKPFDLVFIYNLKPPQLRCGNHAVTRFGLPVVLEYEDDAFLKVEDATGTKIAEQRRQLARVRLLAALSGCVAGSLDLLSQAPGQVPKLLLPGVVGDVSSDGHGLKRNWVVFSGTHHSFQGLEQLVKAWKLASLPGWELHIAGQGEITSQLHTLADNSPTIVFHGVLNRRQNAEFLNQGRISVVPYEVEKTRGFSFKTIECLAAGIHVITTRLRALETLEPELKAGITYLDDNRPETIADCLRTVIRDRRYERTVPRETQHRYGPDAVSKSLGVFLDRVTEYGIRKTTT